MATSRPRDGLTVLPLNCVTRRWLIRILVFNAVVFVGALAYLGVRATFGELIFCEIGDSTWGQQRWTGVIPEPSCVYRGTVEGIEDAEVVVPPRIPPVHFLIVSGVTIGLCVAGLRAPV